MPDNLAARFILPSNVKVAFDAILSAILTRHDTIERLSRQMGEFSSRLENALARNEFIDRSLAERLHRQSSALLGLCRADPSAAFVPYVLAAIDYFLREDDASPDFDDPFDGFTDDALVIQQVITVFGLESELAAKMGGAA